MPGAAAPQMRAATPFCVAATLKNAPPAQRGKGPIQVGALQNRRSAAPWTGA
jgi:hypothetical protein